MRGLRSDSVSYNWTHADGSTGQNGKLSLVDRTVAVAPKRKRGRSTLRPLLVLIIIVVMVAGAFSLASRNRDTVYLPAHTAAQTILSGFVLSYQHADDPGGLYTCTACMNMMPWHPTPVLWDDVKYGGAPFPPPGDNQYGPIGSPDDCPHCIVYSGPACIQMINLYRHGGPPVPQDQIYDHCEWDTLAGEQPGNGFCERHGYGVTDGTGVSVAEIQKSFDHWVNPHHQHNQWDASALTASTLCSYITSLYPVLWDDHGGWPSNMDRTWPIPPEDTVQGHYKVIAGYDDMGTPGTSDDYALIYDPWPGYNDLTALNPTPRPLGALQGPGGTQDPYWLPVSTVLGDTNDLFLVEYAAIPEFSSLLIPIVGMTVIALVAIRIRAARRDS